MIIAIPDDMNGFTRQPPDGTGCEELFVSDGGHEPVVLIHEMPAITPEVMHLARVFLAEGFKVYLPSLMGRPGQVPTAVDQASAFAAACVRAQILALVPGDFTRGAVTGLRNLVRTASLACDNGPVGVIGLCLTGGFAIAAATGPQVSAAVACEPSIPFPPFGSNIDLSSGDADAVAKRLGEGALVARLYRFEGDSLSPCERLRRYGRVFPAGFGSRCLPDAAADPARTSGPKHHSVVTNHLIEAPGSLTLAARDEIVALFKWRLRGGPEPAMPAGLRDCLKDGCARARIS